MKKLTPKQTEFCEQYLIDLNATQAAIRAGYSENSARELAKQLMQMEHVREKISSLQLARSKRTEITADQVLFELKKIAMSNISDFLEVNEVTIRGGKKKKVVEVFNTEGIDKEKMSAVASIKMTREGVWVQLHDKVKALETLGRHLGILDDDANKTLNQYNITMHMNQPLP